MTSTAYAGHHGLHELGKLRQWRCTYCERETHCRVCNPRLNGLLAATRDHVLARSRGGPSSRQNLVLACQNCNQKKGAGVPGDDLPDTWLQAPPRRRRPQPAVVRLATTCLTVPGVSWRACSDGWHKTEHQAAAAAAALLAATGQRFDAYNCGFCHRWHVERVREQEPA